MRTRSYLDGKPIWTDHGPGYGGSVKLGGDLVVSPPRSDAVSRQQDSAARHRERQRKADNCSLTGRCRHTTCVALRALEAGRLYYGDPHMTMREIGKRLGGRSHSSIVNMLVSVDPSVEDAA